jgi:hypothetical protein
MASDPTTVTKMYEQIPLESMQQVADSYMAWYVDRVTRQLDDTMASLRAELRENDQKEASFRPSPQELEAIERLQRSGVTGVDLLDRMVEQGDEWLAVTMKRLDHFERTGLAPKDYSTWCEHALSGAYDWIDHDRLGGNTGSHPAVGRGAGRGAPAQASSNSGSNSGQSRGGPNVPDWLANRNAPRNAAPASTPSASGDVPTAPVPTMQNRPSDSGTHSPGSSNTPVRPPAPISSDADPNDDASRRNIFRIFTN